MTTIQMIRNLVFRGYTVCFVPGGISDVTVCATWYGSKEGDDVMAGGDTAKEAVTTLYMRLDAGARRDARQDNPCMPLRTS